MLVLSRKESQKVVIGDDVTITVVKVAGERVRIGIEAPDEMLILRHELDEHAATDMPNSKQTEKIAA